MKGLNHAGLDESQVKIKVAGRNINNLWYADDATLTAESEEELKSLLMRVIEQSEKPGLKLNIQKTKTMSSGSTTSWQIEGAFLVAQSVKNLPVVPPESNPWVGKIP